ncbi:MAG: hypothetical protein F6J98_01860 [Moorea sp. SIO4G2]|nr:hypothetical protein [Moorena sp. SIO4G2]
MDYTRVDTAGLKPGMISAWLCSPEVWPLLTNLEEEQNGWYYQNYEWDGSGVLRLPKEHVSAFLNWKQAKIKELVATFNGAIPVEKKERNPAPTKKHTPIDVRSYTSTVEYHRTIPRLVNVGSQEKQGTTEFLRSNDLNQEVAKLCSQDNNDQVYDSRLYVSPCGQTNELEIDERLISLYEKYVGKIKSADKEVERHGYLPLVNFSKIADENPEISINDWMKSNKGQTAVETLADSLCIPRSQIEDFALQYDENGVTWITEDLLPSYFDLLKNGDVEDRIEAPSNDKKATKKVKRKANKIPHDWLKVRDIRVVLNKKLKINATAQQLNKILQEEGLQEKVGRTWKVTSKGKKVGTGAIIRWSPEVVKVLETKLTKNKGLCTLAEILRRMKIKAGNAVQRREVLGKDANERLAFLGLQKIGIYTTKKGKEYKVWFPQEKAANFSGMKNKITLWNESIIDDYLLDYFYETQHIQLQLKVA